MGLFGKLFSRKPTKEELHAESIIEKAFENAKKPQPPDLSDPLIFQTIPKASENARFSRRSCW
jgi:hypothetical protein